MGYKMRGDNSPLNKYTHRSGYFHELNRLLTM